MSSTVARPLVLVTALLLLTIPALAAEPEAEPRPVTVIQAGKLIDVEGGRVLDRQTILLEGETIREVGTDVAVPPGATVIDLSGAVGLAVLIVARVRISSQASGDD